MRATAPRALVALAAIGGLLVSSMTPAVAHRATKEDPNDRGPLDIRETSFSHGPGNIKISQTSDDPWRPSLLGVDDGGDNDSALLFQFESRGNEYTDYVVLVDYVEGSLRAQLRRWVPAGEQTNESVFVSRVKVRKNSKTVTVSFKMRRLHPRKRHIGWSAQSIFKDDGACSSSCEDFAPNNRYVYRHLL